MSVAVSRRKLLLGSLSLLTLATPAFAQTNLLYGGESDGFVRDPSLLPPPESPVDFEITPANLKKIPANIVIFKADYDTETALKTKYNISRQHTFVYVDKAGKALKTWSGGATAEILENTK